MLHYVMQSGAQTKTAGANRTGSRHLGMQSFRTAYGVTHRRGMSDTGLPLLQGNERRCHLTASACHSQPRAMAHSHADIAVEQLKTPKVILSAMTLCGIFFF